MLPESARLAAIVEYLDTPFITRVMRGGRKYLTSLTKDFSARAVTINATYDLITSVRPNLPSENSTVFENLPADFQFAIHGIIEQMRDDYPSEPQGEGRHVLERAEKYNQYLVEASANSLLLAAAIDMLNNSIDPKSAEEVKIALAQAAISLHSTHQSDHQISAARSIIQQITGKPADTSSVSKTSNANPEKFSQSIFISKKEKKARNANKLRVNLALQKLSDNPENLSISSIMRRALILTTSNPTARG